MTAATVATAPREVLTTAEVADRLGVTPRTVRGMAERGDLPSFRLTPRSPRRFRTVDVDRLLEHALSGAAS